MTLVSNSGVNKNYLRFLISKHAHYSYISSLDGNFQFITFLGAHEVIFLSTALTRNIIFPIFFTHIYILAWCDFS